MVHFTRCGPASLFYSADAVQGSLPAGYPIRQSADQWICAPPRGLSQLITAFIVWQLQGIRHGPIFRLTILSFPLRSSLAASAPSVKHSLWRLALPEPLCCLHFCGRTLIPPFLCFPSLILSKITIRLVFTNQKISKELTFDWDRIELNY